MVYTIDFKFYTISIVLLLDSICYCFLNFVFVINSNTVPFYSAVKFPLQQYSLFFVSFLQTFYIFYFGILTYCYYITCVNDIFYISTVLSWHFMSIHLSCLYHKSVRSLCRLFFFHISISTALSLAKFFFYFFSLFSVVIIYCLMRSIWRFPTNTGCVVHTDIYKIHLYMSYTFLIYVLRVQ